jgi:hypothetical protein
MAAELNLNLGVFSRVPFVRDDGTLTREAQAAMAVVQRRTGDMAGLVYADTITNVPDGGIAATNVQDALNELDTEKAATGSVTAAQAYAIQRANHTGTQTAATISDFSAAADARVAAAVGVSVQAYDADLATWAGKTAPAGTVVGTSDAQALTNKTITSPIINNPTGALTVSSGSLGYAAGNGGTVTQTTNKSTGVTLDKMSGDITMDTANLLAGTSVSFTLTNSNIAATDLVIADHQSAGTAGAYKVTAQAAAGSALVTVRNLTAGNLAEAIVIRFVVFKAATS